MKTRMLLVDDEEVLLEPMSRYFGRQGWQVTTAREREEAEALLENRAFDVIVLDLALKGFGLEGLDLLRGIRLAGVATPVLVVSGLVTPEVEAELRRHGASDVLQKPQSLGEIAMAVQRLTGEPS